MATRRVNVQEWLAEVIEEGQDSLGAYELPLGVAVLVGYIVMWALRGHPGWGLTVLWLLSLAALWFGARLEYTQCHALGKRRFRGTLYRRFTWLVAICSLVLAWLLVALAHGRAWNQLEGWYDGPIVMMLTLGIYHLAMGLKTNTRRWVWLGGALCLLAVLLPGVPWLRNKLYLATALFAGGSLIAAGLVGRRRFEREARLPRAE